MPTLANKWWSSLAIFRPWVSRFVAAGFLLGARAANGDGGPLQRAAVTAAVLPVAPSDALTAKCTVCAAHGIHRKQSFKSACFTFKPESDVQKQMSLSCKPKQCTKRCVHALKLMGSCRPQNGATPRGNSVMKKSSMSMHRSARDP